MPAVTRIGGSPVSYKRLTVCRCCRSTALEEVLDLGEQPLANSYSRAPTLLPTYPLQLLVCLRCFLCQLRVVVDPDRMFREYLYVTGTSHTFRQHFADLATEAMDWCVSRPNTVLDLACNDGTLL